MQGERDQAQQGQRLRGDEDGMSLPVEHELPAGDRPVVLNRDAQARRALAEALNPTFVQAGRTKNKEQRTRSYAAVRCASTAVADSGHGTAACSAMAFGRRPASQEPPTISSSPSTVVTVSVSSWKTTP